MSYYSKPLGELHHIPKDVLDRHILGELSKPSLQMVGRAGRAAAEYTLPMTQPHVEAEVGQLLFDGLIHSAVHYTKENWAEFNMMRDLYDIHEEAAGNTDEAQYKTMRIEYVDERDGELEDIHHNSHTAFTCCWYKALKVVELKLNRRRYGKESQTPGFLLTFKYEYRPVQDPLHSYYLRDWTAPSPLEVHITCTIRSDMTYVHIPENFIMIEFEKKNWINNLATRGKLKLDWVFPLNHITQQATVSKEECMGHLLLDNIFEEYLV